MVDPYIVLGVPRDASEEEIKEAYKQLARRYQSEGGYGPLSDISMKKMQELDEAYDAIMLGRNPSFSSGGRYTGYDQRQGSARSNYPDVRAKISSNRLDDAETLLEGVQPSLRDAEWHYLKGMIAQNRGWFDDAERNFSTACEMDSGNFEFATAYNKLRNDRSGGYRTVRNNGRTDVGKRGCSGCEICQGLICCDCCCECLGGDCIPCC